MEKEKIELNKCIEDFKNKTISTRKFLNLVNDKHIDEVEKLTAFLNCYNNISVQERLYYIIHDIHSIVKCKYCNNKAIWSNRLNDGYKDICNCKKCRSKQLIDIHKGSKKISNNRDMYIKNKIISATNINDNIIKELFIYDKYEKFVYLNNEIEKYLKQRYFDSESILETIQRIRLNINEKPLCPECGKPVKWIGKKTKMYTTFCCNSCAAKSKFKNKNEQLNINNSTIINNTPKIYGFLRETEKYIKGNDPDTGLCRTSLLDYLTTIFPEIPVNEWIHDKKFGKLSSGENCLKRPDYRCDRLKLIIEFDGLQHYTIPTQILQDIENTKIYESEGYKVVRIPYFIQLTNSAVKQLFNRDIKIPLFNSNVPSLGILSKCTPAFCCPAGIKRMAEEFIKFPEQLAVNLKELEKYDNELSGLSYLKDEISKLELRMR